LARLSHYYEPKLPHAADAPVLNLINQLTIKIKSHDNDILNTDACGLKRRVDIVLSGKSNLTNV